MYYYKEQVFWLPCILIYTFKLFFLSATRTLLSFTKCAKMTKNVIDVASIQQISNKTYLGLHLIFFNH